MLPTSHLHLHTADVAALAAAMGDNLLAIAARCREAALAITRGKGGTWLQDLTGSVIHSFIYANPSCDAGKSWLEPSAAAQERKRSLFDRGCL